MRVLLVGAGKAGQALIRLLRDDPTIEVAGVVDSDSQAPGLAIARELGLPVSASFDELLNHEKIDLVIDVTGNSSVRRDINRLKSDGTEIIGGVAARFIWQLVEARRMTSLLEDKYQLTLRELEARADSEFIIGNNPQMQEVSRLIAKVAPAPTTVLITGESGTGKELVARSIHRHSPRAHQPLVTLNCTALSPALLESELFGYKRGAFTGAYRDQIGLFEKANGSTMFLDEIGDMALETQAKLLRTLQTGEIRAVGDVRSKHVSVRIIAATNRDLNKAIRDGHFRKDLLYRVNTFNITLPPLRERVEDIPALAEYFLQRARARINKRVEVFSPDTMSLLCHHSWPGNLRELQNVIKCAVILTSSSIIEPEHLPFLTQDRSFSFGPNTLQGFMPAKKRAIETFEKQALSSFLQQTGGNISQAAELARIPRRTFHRLIEKHNLRANGYRSSS